MARTATPSPLHPPLSPPFFFRLPMPRAPLQGAGAPSRTSSAMLCSSPLRSLARRPPLPELELARAPALVAKQGGPRPPELQLPTWSWPAHRPLAPAGGTAPRAGCLAADAGGLGGGGGPARWWHARGVRLPLHHLPLLSASARLRLGPEFGGVKLANLELHRAELRRIWLRWGVRSVARARQQQLRRLLLRAAATSLLLLELWAAPQPSGGEGGVRATASEVVPSMAGELG